MSEFRVIVDSNTCMICLVKLTFHAQASRFYMAGNWFWEIKFESDCGEFGLSGLVEGFD